jgi:hypothetical protein
MYMLLRMKMLITRSPKGFGEEGVGIVSAEREWDVGKRALRRGNGFFDN